MTNPELWNLMTLTSDFIKVGQVHGTLPPWCENALHVRLVVVADLLDADVVLGQDVGLGGGVGPGHRHHAGDVLEVLLVFHFDLREKKKHHSLASGLIRKKARCKAAG